MRAGTPFPPKFFEEMASEIFVVELTHILFRQIYRQTLWTFYPGQKKHFFGILQD